MGDKCVCEYVYYNLAVYERQVLGVALVCV